MEINRAEVFRQYRETIERIDRESSEARNRARLLLNEQLDALRITLHEELKAVRAIKQKVKES